MNLIIKQCWKKNKTIHIKGFVDGMEFYVSEITNKNISKPQDLTEKQIANLAQVVYQLKEQEILVGIQ